MLESWICANLLSHALYCTLAQQSKFPFVVVPRTSTQKGVLPVCSPPITSRCEKLPKGLAVMLKDSPVSPSSFLSVNGLLVLVNGTRPGALPSAFDIIAPSQYETPYGLLLYSTSFRNTAAPSSLLFCQHLRVTSHSSAVQDISQLSPVVFHGCHHPPSGHHVGGQPQAATITAAENWCVRDVSPELSCLSAFCVSNDASLYFVTRWRLSIVAK